MSATAAENTKAPKPAFSNPFVALLYKEYRRQYPLALGVVLLGVLIQAACIASSIFPEVRFEPDLFAIAFFVTALYSGAAAATLFSDETEEGTFGFLRKLPLAPKTVMSAKVAWLAVSTPLVLAASCLISGLLLVFVPWSSLYGETLWGVFGLAILEAAVWGLFWSPRCQKGLNAILATYFIASLFSYASACFCAENPDILSAYLRAVPIRLGVVLIVAIFACRNMVRWFDINVNKPGDAGNRGRNLLQTLPYPKRLQSPFFALLHHGFRQSQVLLLLGLALSLLFSTIFFVDLRSFLAKISLIDHMDRVVLLIFSGVFYIWFCGNIFGQDQTNSSFRILSRFGMSPSKVWWSRILLFGSIAALPCIAFLIANRLGHIFYATFYEMNHDLNIERILDPLVVAGFLIPFSVGAFVSINVRNTMVAAALTGAGFILLLFWMMLGIFLCWFNPLWTTLPICVALLIASRLRAADWLRERLTWKSRIMPLIPFFATVLAVLVAIPPARIYSVPFVSLEQVRAELDKLNLPEMLSPEQRIKLFEKVAADLDKPFTQDDWDQYIKYYRHVFQNWNFMHKMQREHPEIWANGSEKEKADLVYQSLRQKINTLPTFEEWAMQNFSDNYRLVQTGKIFDRHYDYLNVLKLYNRLPWEKRRALRVLRRTSFFCIKSASISYKNNRSWHLDDLHEFGLSASAAFDQMPWDWMMGAEYYFYGVCQLRLHYVEAALHCYYLEHENTLPKSLDELVGKYLNEIPIDPKTGEPMKYQPERDEELIEANKNNQHASQWSRKPGWPQIFFERKIKLDGQLKESEFSVRRDLTFLPDYAEYGKKD